MSPRPEGSGRPTVLGDTREARSERSAAALKPAPKVYVRPEPVPPYIDCDECKVTYNLTPEQDTPAFRRALLAVHNTRPGDHWTKYVPA